MTASDLIARLRHFSKLLGGRDLPEVMSEAADHIATLESENARLVEERGEAIADHRLFAHHRKKQGDHDTALIEAAEVRATAAEAEREVLRAALKATSLGLDDLMRTLYSPELYRPEHVAESHDRIGRAGAPLAYVADLQEQAARALSGEAPKSEDKP